MRLRAAELFGQECTDRQVADEPRVTRMSANRWRRAWRAAGESGLRSKGPASRPRLGEGEFARLEAALARGPLAHGWRDQRWTLVRVQLVIARMFRVSYSGPGVWKLLRRGCWSCQVPAPAGDRPRRCGGGGVEGGGVAAGGKTALDLGAHICFEDECGKTMRPPKARTWSPRGHTPVIRVPGSPGGRASLAGLVCYRSGIAPACCSASTATSGAGANRPVSTCAATVTS
ncbi:winged helix-turn-helix domain-containing protein [Streptomyces sp. CBMA152]|uniref:winged helix-turn-helix domain-containing protein n=1 Tax=Streptomyces sp. CBMA152 TaxID=1896312 RepID=UPI002948C04E|nr:winged helix-turn-helix domain-containing protein [Streptomyces sp. CBMA152]